jgi:phage terminase large subunit-like protein
LEPRERLAVLQRLAYLLPYSWSRHARTDQLPPSGAWLVWLILAGRGWGKTRTGAEWIKDEALRTPGTRWAVVAPTYADARDTCVEGESGLLSVLPDDRVKDWNRSLGELILVNGSRIKLFSADKPDRLRGPQHHGAWCDELAAWTYPEAWDQLQFGLRLGDYPRTVVTTTPKPIPMIRQLLARDDVHITRGATFDNAANLSEAALATLRARYEGTRLGRQELHGEVLEDVPGALWVLATIEAARARRQDEWDLVRVVTAIDPAVTSGEDSDETGIVTAGVSESGWCPHCGPITNGPHAVILADDTVKTSPDAWCRRAVDALELWKGDRVIGETNNGGDLIETVLRTVDSSVPYRKVTATRGKRLRAEPVAALYEQGRVHHAGGFPELEDQQCSWTPDSSGSPDRLDALVWALTDLLLDVKEPARTGLLVR